MIKTKKLDLSKKDFLLYHKQIVAEIKLLKLSSSDRGYQNELCRVLRTIFPLDYIILLGKDMYYNIQTKKNFIWIFTIDQINVIIYKARPFAFPTFQGFEVFDSKDKENFLKPELFEILETRKNTLTLEIFEEIKEYMIIFFNKHKGNTVLHKGKEVDTFVFFMKSLKTFCFSKINSYFLHIVMVPKRTFAHRVPQENLLVENKEIEIVFKLKDKGKKMNLLIFEKKGKEDAFLKRCLAKWKEFFVFFFMFLLLITLSVCNSDKADKLGKDVEFVCRNKTTFLMTFGFMVIFFVLFKHFVNKKSRRSK